jgi:hypothetical protein
MQFPGRLPCTLGARLGSAHGEGVDQPARTCLATCSATRGGPPCNLLVSNNGEAPAHLSTDSRSFPTARVAMTSSAPAVNISSDVPRRPNSHGKTLTRSSSIRSGPRSSAAKRRPFEDLAIIAMARRSCRRSADPCSEHPEHTPCSGQPSAMAVSSLCKASSSSLACNSCRVLKLLLKLLPAVLIEGITSSGCRNPKTCNNEAACWLDVVLCLQRASTAPFSLVKQLVHRALFRWPAALSS